MLGRSPFMSFLASPDADLPAAPLVPDNFFKTSEDSTVHFAQVRRVRSYSPDKNYGRQKLWKTTHIFAYFFPQFFLSSVPFLALLGAILRAGQFFFKKVVIKVHGEIWRNIFQSKITPRREDHFKLFEKNLTCFLPENQYK